MGMFDHLKVKQELPLPEEIKNKLDWWNHSFQTKDLDNYLGEYIINEYRELVEVVVEREYIPYSEEEKKKLNLKPWDLWKEIKEGATTYKNLQHHGSVTFYTYEDFDDVTDFWVEFKAYFVYGKLDKIELVEFKKEESLKIHNQKIGERRKQEQKRPWNVFKKYASYLGWSWFWRNVSNLLYRFSELLSSIRMTIMRNLL
jgi:hypothetical protein